MRACKRAVTYARFAPLAVGLSCHSFLGYARTGSAPDDDPVGPLFSRYVISHSWNGTVLSKTYFHSDYTIAWCCRDAFFYLSWLESASVFVQPPGKMAEVGGSFCCNCLFLVAHKLPNIPLPEATHAWCQPKGKLSWKVWAKFSPLLLRLGKGEREREKKKSFWNIRSVTLGMMWNWPLEFCMVHPPPAPIRSGAAGLNTWGALSQAASCQRKVATPLPLT